MHNFPTANEIEQSAKELGISMASLCEGAGIANSTFTRFKAGKDIRYSNIVKLVSVLTKARKQKPNN